ncbi:MAG TPA: hypothetical protein VM938_03930 [Acidimicrobiales bacterium]|nr:hypothetical protein [Acidimicrobiales bacterium]
MHPIERLRHVARAEGAGASLLVREAAGALAGFGSDPPGMVTACRRLVDRHPAVGPMWWLAANVLAAGEPVAAAWRAADELDSDPTPAALAKELPDDATVVVVGWPELAADALRRRADLEVLVVDAAGEGAGLARRLRGAGVDAIDVPDAGIGAAVAESDLVLLEAGAIGHDGLVAVAGSRAAAAVAQHAGTPVWVVAGVGRALPDALWDALVDRLGADTSEPWDRIDEVVPLDLVDELIGSRRATCAVAPELLKPLD